MTTPHFFTLSQVTARIAEIFAPHLGKVFWVQAEISSGRERGRLASQGMALRSSDPAQNLKRGFALAYDFAGKVVPSVRGRARGDVLNIRAGDGTIASNVERVEADEHGR